MLSVSRLLGYMLVASSLAVTSSAIAAGPGYLGPAATPEKNMTQNFRPIIDTSDFIKTCGNYQKIHQSNSLQRVSRHWQRCYAYTSATLSAMRDIERTAPIKQFCVPGNVSAEYTIDLTVKYANKVPAAREENPAKVMLEALAVRYPC